MRVATDQQPLAQRPRERDHLDRHRRPLPQPRHQLRLVGHHHEPPGRTGHHLLAQVRAAKALDQRQVGRDLVGAVDREIEAGPPLEVNQPDAQLTASLRRALRRGDARYPR